MDSKVIKVRFEDETRKFRVNKLSVIDGIKMIIGSFKSISYVDDDGDTVHCYTEDEAIWRFLKRGFRRFLSILFATKRRKAKIKAHALPWSLSMSSTHLQSKQVIMLTKRRSVSLVTCPACLLDQKKYYPSPIPWLTNV